MFSSPIQFLSNAAGGETFLNEYRISRVSSVSHILLKEQYNIKRCAPAMPQVNAGKLFGWGVFALSLLSSLCAQTSSAWHLCLSLLLVTAPLPLAHLP